MWYEVGSSGVELGQVKVPGLIKPFPTMHLNNWRSIHFPFLIPYLYPVIYQKKKLIVAHFHYLNRAFFHLPHKEVLTKCPIFLYEIAFMEKINLCTEFIFLTTFKLIIEKLTISFTCFFFNRKKTFPKILVTPLNK